MINGVSGESGVNMGDNLCVCGAWSTVARGSASVHSQLLFLLSKKCKKLSKLMRKGPKA